MISITLKQAHQDFVEHLKQSGRATSTILAYGKDIEQFIDAASKNGRSVPQDIQAKDIETFKSNLNDQSYTPKSISRKINSIKAFSRYLVQKGYITKNPAQNIAHPKYEIAPPRILTKMEYRALRDACRTDPRISSIVELLLQTGIRIGELASLTLDDVNIDKKELTVQAYESHGERKVSINKPALDALEMYLKVRPKTRERAIFITKTGNHFLVRNIRTAIDRFFRIADIKNAKVNDLRHTFIAEQLSAGTPLTYISKLVGHKRLSTTEKYLKLIKEQAEKTEVKLEEL